MHLLFDFQHADAVRQPETSAFFLLSLYANQPDNASQLNDFSVYFFIYFHLFNAIILTSIRVLLISHNYPHYIPINSFYFLIFF